MLRIFLTLVTALALIAAVGIATAASANAQEPVVEAALTETGTESVDAPASIEEQQEQQTDENEATASPPGDGSAGSAPPEAAIQDESATPATEPASEHLAPIAETAEHASEPVGADQIAIDAGAFAEAEVSAARAAADAAASEAVAVASEATANVAQTSAETAIAGEADAATVAEDNARGTRNESTLHLLGQDAASPATDSALERVEQSQATAEAAVTEATAAAEAAAADAHAQADAAVAEAANAAAEAQAAADAAAAEAAANIPGVPAPEVIEAMIEVLLEVRAQITDPIGQQLIDDAIAVLQEAYAQAVAAAQAANGSGGSGTGGSDSTATSDDTGDVNVDATAGDTGDATANAGGSAQSGDTGDSTATGDADSDPPPPDEDPPPDDGGGQCPQGTTATTPGTAADNSAAVSFACPGPDHDDRDPEKGPQISCETKIVDGKVVVLIVAGRSADHRSTVAQLHGHAARVWAAWLGCLGDEEDGSEAPTAEPLPSDEPAPIVHTEDVVPACDPTDACGEATSAAPVVAVVAPATAAPPPDTQADDPLAKRRHSVSGERMAPAPTSPGNSRTSETSAPGSAQASLISGTDLNFVLSYGTGTVSPTGDARSRSDKPLTPPG